MENLLTNDELLKLMSISDLGEPVDLHDTQLCGVQMNTTSENEEEDWKDERYGDQTTKEEEVVSVVGDKRECPKNKHNERQRKKPTAPLSYASDTDQNGIPAYLPSRPM